MKYQDEEWAADPLDTNEDDFTLSPVKDLFPSVSGHDRQEVAENVYPHFSYEVHNNTMWKLLKLSEERFSKDFSEAPHFQTRGSRISKQTPTKCSIYLNTISETVRKRIRQTEWLYIKFVDTPYERPKDHATGSINRPDLVALQIWEKDPEIPENKFWSALEATGELKSSHRDSRGAFAQARSYVGFLLQARPDLTTGLGIYAEEEGFKLILHNSFGSFGTKLCSWTAQADIALLCAWVWRLYEPIIPDLTIIRTIIRPAADAVECIPPTFDIETPDGLFQDCSIRTVGGHFGRRTIVLDTKIPGTVIKEQYVDPSRRYEEGQTLERIHQEGIFPGVVRVGYSGPVPGTTMKYDKKWKVQAGLEQIVPEDASEKVKMRLVLRDAASPLLDAKTPQDVLIAIYDLLEVTRVLYTKYQILHRDISGGNVCLRDNLATVDKSFNQTLTKMCFASHMLQSHLGLSDVHPLETKLLLIDFDASENKRQVKGKATPKPWTGTGLFIAEFLRTKKRKIGYYELPPMPKLDAGAAVAYKKCVPSRLTDFPQMDIKKEEIVNWEEKMGVGVEDQHKLRYDAESAFWLLLYWTVLACPAGKDVKNHPIPENFWRDFTTLDKDTNYRSALLECLPKQVIMPEYGPLENLIKDMAKQLVGDYEVSQSKHRKDDAFLHEAFQRTILNFLFKHHSAPFMTLEKGLENRKVEERQLMRPPLSRASIAKNRASRSISVASSSTGVPPQSDISMSTRGGAETLAKRPRDEEVDDPRDGYNRPSKRRRFGR